MFCRHTMPTFFLALPPPDPSFFLAGAALPPFPPLSGFLGGCHDKNKSTLLDRSRTTRFLVVRRIRSDMIGNDG